MPHSGIFELEIRPIDDLGGDEFRQDSGMGEYDEYQLRAETHALKQRQVARHHAAKHRDRRSDR